MYVTCDLRQRRKLIHTDARMHAHVVTHSKHARTQAHTHASAEAPSQTLTTTYTCKSIRII